MKLHILTENTAGSHFMAEHGLSYLVETDNEKILFDTGHSDVYIKNAKLLGIDIHTEVEKVVLSHGHWDHGNGLKFIKDKTLFTHPSSFIKRFRKSDKSPVGIKLQKNEIQSNFNLNETSNALRITENLWFLGEIPRDNNFESQTTSFIDEEGNNDFIPDDSALVAIINKELVIVTGCSHSGICNICEYARKVTGLSKINMVIGGFHLKHNNLQTQKTIEYFKTNKVKRIYPSHCTALPAMAAFYAEFKIQQLKTGMILEI